MFNDALSESLKELFLKSLSMQGPMLEIMKEKINGLFKVDSSYRNSSVERMIDDEIVRQLRDLIREHVKEQLKPAFESFDGDGRALSELTKRLAPAMLEGLFHKAVGRLVDDIKDKL